MLQIEKTHITSYTIIDVTDDNSVKEATEKNAGFSNETKIKLYLPVGDIFTKYDTIINSKNIILLMEIHALQMITDRN
jgi:hypothetical protein